VSHFVEHHLGDFFRIKHGYAFKGAFFAKKGDYIVLTPGNFREDGGLKSQGEKEKFYSAEPPPDFILRSGDLLTVMTDLTQEARILGASAFIREDGRLLHNQRLGKVIDLDTNRLDKNYLYHLFNWSHVRDQLKGSATGATVRHTAPDRIYAVSVPLPPLAPQERIASILSAYDDLIENNTRRIAILEEMARRLYEEWFVHFRFPGHEEAEFEGEVPKKWSSVPLKSIARLRSGYAFKSKTFVENGKHRLVTIKNVQDGGFNPNNVNRLDDLPPNVPQHCHLSNGDVLLSLTGNVGRVCIVYGGEFLLNQRVAKIEPASPEYRAFVYFSFRDIAFRKRLENLATGVAQQNLSPVKTEELPIHLPDKNYVERFEAFAGKVMAQCSQLNETNANLRAQRDLLLPKLVSGEIDVSEVEKAMEAAE
jgi:type I restriction enzyme, S subunit